jgi:putative hemolysin
MLSIPVFTAPALLILIADATHLAASPGGLVAAAFLLVAETLAVIGISTEVALERHSRSRVLALSDAEESFARTERLLVHVPTYEVTARLVRFLGNTLLMIGIAYVVLEGKLDTVHPEEAGVPWGRFGLLLALLFLVMFLINDVLVRLAVARRPNKTMLAALPLLEVLRYVLAPLRLPMVWLVRLIFRINLGAPAPSAREEILETVEEGEREGSFTAEEADMIESIIEMETTVVRDVQTPRVDMVMLQVDTPLDEAVVFVNEEGCSRIPVYEKDRDDVVGVLYARDLLGHWRRDGVPGKKDRTVRAVMRKPFFVPENKPLNDLMKEMRSRKVHLAVVLDEFNGTSGLVTIEDLLEEIVGEIEDEYDAEEDAGTEQIGAGRFRVEGRTPIEELNSHLDVDMPIEDDFETVAGLVFDRLGKVPEPGEQVTCGPVIITVIEADERTAQTLEVEVITPPPAAPEA